MPNTYGYCRCSTDTQTLEPQLLALVAAGVPGANIASDDATSGSIPFAERPGIQTLLGAARKGDTIVAYSLSRIGRSTLDVLTLLELLESRGIKFRSLTEPVDTATPMGKAMLSIMAALAQLERDLAVERTKAGLVAARARGSRIGAMETPGRRAAVQDCLARGLGIAGTAAELGLAYNSVKRMAGKLQAEESA